MTMGQSLVLLNRITMLLVKQAPVKHMHHWGENSRVASSGLVAVEQLWGRPGFPNLEAASFLQEEVEREKEAKKAETARYEKAMEAAARLAAVEKERKAASRLKEVERADKVEKSRKETERLLAKQQAAGIDRKKVSPGGVMQKEPGVKLQL